MCKYLFIGDVELKQNKFLPPEKQIVTANPDINVVSSLNLDIICHGTVELIVVVRAAFCCFSLEVHAILSSVRWSSAMMTTLLL